MKALHLAAVALVSWYLMMPPITNDYPIGNVTAPLSQWMRRPTIYRDKEECEEVLDRQHRLTNSVWAKFYKHAQCVSSDDPRLKSK